MRPKWAPLRSWRSQQFGQCFHCRLLFSVGHVEDESDANRADRVYLRVSSDSFPDLFRRARRGKPRREPRREAPRSWPPDRLRPTPRGSRRPCPNILDRPPHSRNRDRTHRSGTRASSVSPREPARGPPPRNTGGEVSRERRLAPDRRVPAPDRGLRVSPRGPPARTVGEPSRQRTDRSAPWPSGRGSPDRWVAAARGRSRS